MKTQLVAILCLIGAPVFGQSLGLSLGSAESGFLGNVEIPLRLSTNDEEVSAVQAVIDWDASMGRGIALNVEPAVDGLAEFVFVHVDTNWMTVGITSVGSPLSGDGILLAKLVIECHSGPEATDTPVVFRDGVHRVPGSVLVLTNTLAVAGTSRTSANGLGLSDGSFRCVGPEICDDTIGNDGDGLVDGADPDCLPEIEVTPLGLEYGEILLGGTRSLFVTIRNTGSAELRVSDIDLGVGTSPAFRISGRFAWSDSCFADSTC